MIFRININNLARPGKNLSQRAVVSGFWVLLLKAVQQLFNSVRLVILARLLSPQDFGLMGIALLSMTTLETLSQTGFQQALIQKKCNIKPYLDSAWTVLILRSLILFTTLYLIAPYTAIFFGIPEAKPMIQVIGFSTILQAFTNIGIIHFQKELEFDKQFIYQLSGILTDFVVAITATLIFRNVWALVFGLLAGNATMLITSYLIHPYRPRLRFDIDKTKELFGYGKWVSGSNILIFLVTQGDNIVVGKLLGTASLGFYQMAYTISNLPATEITHVISQVTFPIYSKLQDDISKLREAYLRVLQLTAFISFPIAGLIFVLAHDFTMMFLGDKWMPIIPIIKFLILSGLIRSIQATSGPVFHAVGKTKTDTKVQIIRFVAITIFIYPLISRFELIGVSLAVLISTLVAFIISILMIIKTIGLSARDLLYSIIHPFFCGLLTIFSLIHLKSLMHTGMIDFIVISFIGIFLYIFLSIIIEKIFNYKIITNIKEIVWIFR